jgi:hypothetical protein
MFGLCFWEDETAVVGIEDGVFLARGVELGVFSLSYRGFVVDFVVHLGQERSRCCRKPSTTSELERAKVTAPVSGTQNGVWILLKLLEGDRCLGRDLRAALVKQSNR